PWAEGSLVTHDGQTWSATEDIADNTALAPGSAGAKWRLVSSSETKTNSRLAGHLGGASSQISAAAPTTNPGADALGMTPTGGTSATVNGIILAGGDVRVWAMDRLEVLGVAGSGAVGAVGVGISVLVLNIKSNTD